MTLKDVVYWLSSKSNNDKIKFTEMLLFDITIMNRSLLSDSDISHEHMVESLKWSNELVHRIWRLLIELKGKSNNNFENSLGEYINLYSKQSEGLKKNLPPSIEGTISRFNNLERKK